MNKPTLAALCFVLGLLVAAAICAWKATVPNLPSVLAPPAKELAKEETTVKECQKVVVFRDKVKKKLDLPATVQKAPDKHVVAASPVPASDYPHTMTAVYDSGTGAVDMFLRQDPLPWFALNQRWRFGAFYGASDERSGVALGVLQYEVIQIKKLRATIHAQGSTDSRAFVGAGIAW